MQSHLNQALHNEKFVSDCCLSHPDSYFDWKVTATFYTALHLFRAFCEKRGVDPGNTHHDIACNFDPRRCNGNPLTPIPKWVWQAYNKLQKYSEQARYDVFINPEAENELQRRNFIESKKLLSSLKQYFTAQGVPCMSDTAA
jgi:hypothetical protein